MQWSPELHPEHNRTEAKPSPFLLPSPRKQKTHYEQKESVAYMAIFPAQFNRGDSRLFYLSRNIESVNKIWANSQVQLNYGWSMGTEGWGRVEQRD